MYRVLIPVDDNEERAEKQIDTIGNIPSVDEPIEAHVVYVYEEIETPGEGGGFATGYLDDINESLDELRDPPETVNDVAEALSDRGIDTEIHELVGDPAEAILTASRELDVNMLLMGVRDRSPIGKVVFGSVSQKVILGSEVPVLVAR
ncbi:Nucleotide-binding protein, UspA family [Halanaeroarchaeum sp. HSR-CO]|uniref:universal stress protein n=1 Tax=Halanaeroarchaeum sp. HSR-CO TaxID=2866382 RepID=UPI00217D918E|nr:universal stress protein [Halanaeroarchaeum sp. HSR-CO]UWG46367.1 Nucleotide-binding protein, UspA family [Halanaeroarchaeum sp. HSR-CO]